MNVAIIKYNAGNNFSVKCALHRIGIEATVTDDPSTLINADKIIFPGVGEAASAMSYLRERHLDELIKRLRQPVLGICIGQQLLCRHSQEGDTDGIGIFDVDVYRFHSEQSQIKVPHMGWNTIKASNYDGIIPQSADGKHVYYVHSYYVPVCQYTSAITDYIVPFSAALRLDNFYATQFHPEKSGDIGESILKRFIEI